MNVVRYLRREDIVSYHAADFYRRGLIPAPVISEEKLLAALDRPQASAFGEDAYPTLAGKAAAYLQSFASGHPFIDGNKRAASAACLFFLELNAVKIRASQEALVDLVLAVAKCELREVEDIAARPRVVHTRSR